MRSNGFGISALTVVVFAAAASTAPILTAPSDTAAASSADVRKLQDDLLGSWSIHETDEVASAAGKAVSGEGTEIYRIERGGMPLVEEFHATLGVKEATESAYFWFDASAKRLKGLWCAPQNGEGCGPFRIQRDGERLIMEGEFVAGGERLAWRETYEKRGADAFTQTLFTGKPGTELRLDSTIHATRRK